MSRALRELIIEQDSVSLSLRAAQDAKQRAIGCVRSAIQKRNAAEARVDDADAALKATSEAIDLLVKRDGMTEADYQAVRSRVLDEHRGLTPPEPTS